MDGLLVDGYVKMILEEIEDLLIFSLSMDQLNGIFFIF